jgi:hypothetical protein
MWRHITGVEQPVKKIKLDNNEKLERKRMYDQVKRKRTLDQFVYHPLGSNCYLGNSPQRKQTQ